MNTDSTAVKLSIEQVAQLSGVGIIDLRGLVDHGVLSPAMPDGEPWSFSLDCVMTLQRADHLRRDLALDDHGFALAMMLLGQIEGLEEELGARNPGLRSADFGPMFPVIPDPDRSWNHVQPK
ncbi:MAG: hypothetical protein LH632_05270 [Rhodoferax sp.]|nr:hypothetical protein [Rhodoferax sp.]